MRNLQIQCLTQIVLSLLVCGNTFSQSNTIVPISNSIAKTPIWIITLKDSTIISKITFDSLAGNILYLKTEGLSRTIFTDSIIKIEIERTRILWPLMGIGALFGMLVDIVTYQDPPPDENGVVHNSELGFLQSRMSSIVVKGILGGLIGIFVGTLIDSREEYVEKLDYPGRSVDATQYIKKIFLR